MGIAGAPGATPTRRQAQQPEPRRARPLIHISFLLHLGWSLIHIMEKYLREWRQDAINKHQYDTAIYVADKLLALTCAPPCLHYT
jgi:hypothetical protein